MLSSATTTKTVESVGLLISRLVFSLSMAYGHGWGKLMRFGEDEIRFGDPIGLGPIPSLVLITFAEFFCAIFVAIGFKTRYAAIPLIIGMFVATFIAHGGDPFGKMEKSLMYLGYFILIAATGPGKFSLDAMLSSKKS